MAKVLRACPEAPWPPLVVGRSPESRLARGSLFPRVAATHATSVRFLSQQQRLADAAQAMQVG